MMCNDCIRDMKWITGRTCAKCGKATSKGIVLYTSGDSSIKAAMDNGGITKVHHIDYEVFNILNVFSKATTIVWGE